MDWLGVLGARMHRKLLFACVALAAIVALFSFALRASWISDYGRKKIEFAQAYNERILGLFQSSFYFYYDDQFKPGIEDILKKNPELKRILIISGTGQVAFDTFDLKGGRQGSAQADPRLLGKEIKVFSDPEGLGILLPSGQYNLYFAFSLAQIHLRFAASLVCGLLLVLAFALAFQAYRKGQRLALPGWRRTFLRLSSLKPYSLRSKFLATLILVNLLTGAIIFFSQSQIQKQERTERLVRTSVLLGELSKDSIISSFSNYFYFYYQDKFVPAVRQLLSSKENLEAVRIISRKSGLVVFDSDDMAAGRQPLPGVEGKKAELSEEILSELRAHDTFHQIRKRPNGDSYIQVVTAYRNENQEATFLVEYLFSFASLTKAISEIRRQILIELIPGTLLGVLAAILFAQLIVGPIRKLVQATNAITRGDYDIRVDTKKQDEFGDLMRSFNAMASELKRKNELKKYLSANSYRRITEAPDGVGSLGGARVRATVLFCDIRNFVNVCESLDAEEVTSLLNDYFSTMVEVIYRHKGEVDKFIGDAILAVFYDREDLNQPVNTALHAVYCAMEMRERLKEFNVKRVRNNQATIEIGIGINSGEIISGPIGSPDRMDFTVIGDVVNLANRIEKLSKQGRYTRIVFSHHVESKVRGLLDYEELTRDKIRGKEEGVIVFELIRIKDVSELLSNLSHPDAGIKRHCIELLGYSRNPAALSHLYQKLSDSSDTVRTAAVTAIARLAPKDHEETLDIFFKQLDQENAERVTSTILMCIGRICRNQRLFKLSKYLESSDERIVANAIEALGNSDDPRLIDLIIPFVVSKSNRVKANAAMVLFAKGKVEVLDTLKPMLLHSDPMMRASAAFALGELTVMATAENLAEKLKAIGNAKHFLGELQGCVPLLVSLLKDPDPIVKRNAVIALGKMKDKTAILPLIDNINLELDSREMIQEVAEALRSIGSHRLVREVVKQLG